MAGSSLGYQKLTVSSAAVSPTLPAGCRRVFLTIKDAEVAMRDDGTDPTATVGFPLPIGTVLDYDASGSGLRLIRTGSTDGTAHILYYTG